MSSRSPNTARSVSGNNIPSSGSTYMPCEWRSTLRSPLRSKPRLAIVTVVAHPSEIMNISTGQTSQRTKGPAGVRPFYVLSLRRSEFVLSWLTEEDDALRCREALGDVRLAGLLEKVRPRRQWNIEFAVGLT
jgi:hypothetical protein